MHHSRNPILSGCLSGLVLAALFSLCLAGYTGYLVVFRPHDPAVLALRLNEKGTGSPSGDAGALLDLLLVLLSPSQTAPAAHTNPLILPAGLENRVFALTYGRKNGWGSLRTAATGREAVSMASTFAVEVQHYTTKEVVPIVNPVIREKTQGRYDRNGDPWLREILATAATQDMIVMLDIQLGAECVAQGKEIIDDYVEYEYVWFDVDVEHSCGGVMQAAQLDELAAYINMKRQAHGWRSPALFGFWYFKAGSVIGQPQKTHGDVLVVPMFNGYVSNGDAQRKVAIGRQRLLDMGDGPAGVMWFPLHDRNITLAEVMAGFPQALVFARQ